MEGQTKRETIAEWYATQVFENCTTPIDEVEWMIQNLNDKAFSEIEEFYNDKMYQLEADGFFK